MQPCISPRSIGSVFTNSLLLESLQNITTMGNRNLLYLPHPGDNAF